MLASVYATMTQLIWSSAPMSPAIVASEVETTVWSRAPRKDTARSEPTSRRSRSGDSAAGSRRAAEGAEESERVMRGIRSIG